MIRVSTDVQTEESQLKACIAFCKKQGYEVEGVFQDHGKSAYKNVKRPEYDKVIKLVKNRKIQHIVVWSIDRWTRRGPREFKNSMEYLYCYNVQFHSVKEEWIELININGSFSEVLKDFLFGIMAWMAEEESKQRSKRVRESKKFQKAKDKGLVGRSGLPSEVVEQVLKKLDEGMSYRKIHNEVTYKAKYGKIRHVSVGKISEIANEVRE